MYFKILAASLLLFLFSNTYADPAAVELGAQKYDWQSCYDRKTSQCANYCATSEDINCKDNCEDLAIDKCKSEGLSPTQ